MYVVCMHVHIVHFILRTPRYHSFQATRTDRQTSSSTRADTHAHTSSALIVDPTDSFTILVPQDPSIDVPAIHRVHRSTDFEAQKLRKGTSFSVHEIRRKMRPAVSNRRSTGPYLTLWKEGKS